MRPANAILLTGAVVVAGRWASGQKVTFRLGLGVGVTALLITLVSDSNEQLGKGFAYLILVGATITYGGAIAKGVNKGLKS